MCGSRSSRPDPGALGEAARVRVATGGGGCGARDGIHDDEPELPDDRQSDIHQASQQVQEGEPRPVHGGVSGAENLEWRKGAEERRPFCFQLKGREGLKEERCRGGEAEALGIRH